MNFPEELQAIGCVIYDTQSTTIVARADDPNQTKVESQVLAAEIVKRYNAYADQQGRIEQLEKAFKRISDIEDECVHRGGGYNGAVDIISKTALAAKALAAKEKQ